MNIDAFLTLVEGSRFATTVRDSIWMFPIVESIHVISFSLVVGTVVVIDLRLLGLASTQRSFQRIAADVLKWTWGAFVLTVATGLTMFTTNAQIYYHNAFFRTKMLLLGLAGLNMVLFEVTAGRTVQRWDKSISAPRAGKAAAILSLTIWITIIFMGRIIGFTTHPGKVLPPPPGMNFDNFLQPATSSTGGASRNAPNKK